MRKKYVHLACIWVVFIALFTLGAQSCSPDSEFTPTPVDPTFTKYVAIGDSITQGHMSGDANYFSQGYAYPYLLAKQMNTEMIRPYMVAEDPAGGGFHRTIPGLTGGNLGVSGMDVYLSGYLKGLGLVALDKTVSGWKRTTPFATENSGNFSFDFANELDAVLSPHAATTHGALEVAKDLKPTIVTFWLGNNDALGSVSGTLDQENPDSSTDGVDLAKAYISSSYPYTVAAKLDADDPREEAAEVFYPTSRMATANGFKDAYYYALKKALDDNPNAKIVVANIPDVTGIAHLLSNAEAQQFYITYAGVSSSDLTGVWNATGFGGNAGAMIPFDIALAGLIQYKTLRGSQPIPQALDSLSNGANTGLFDWDINNLDTTELPAIQTRIADLNTAINDVITGVYAPSAQPVLTAAEQARIAFVNANTIFDDIKNNGLEVKDETGTPVSGVLKLRRSYPGAGPSGSNGGIFSLDGVHPGPTAHARMANEFIKSINSKFTLTLPLINEYNIWLKDPYVDHDQDGYIIGLPFTYSSSQIGNSVLPRDTNDSNPAEKPTVTP